MVLPAPARAALLALLLPALARAGGYSFYDFGERRTGMHAVVGRPDDPTAVFHNPAGLADLGGTQLLLSATGVYYDIHFRLYDSQGRLHPPEDEPALAPDRVFAIDPFLAATTALGRDLGVGLAAYVPAGLGAFFPEDTPLRYHATSAYFIAGYATLAAGWRPTRWLSVGAGASLVHVRLKARRYLYLPHLIAGEANPAVYDSRFDEETWDGPLNFAMEASGSGTTGGFTAGVLAHPHPRVGLGVTFVSRSTAALEGRVALTPVANPDLADSAAQETDFVVPPGLRAGVHWQAHERIGVGADYYVFFYGVIDEQRTRIVPDDPDSPGIFAATRIPGTDEYGFTVEKSYSENHVVSGGVEVLAVRGRRFADRLDLMVGGEYDVTPAAEADFSVESPTRDFWTLAAGARWTLDASWRFGLTYGRGFSVPIDVRESRTVPPTNARAGGGSHVLGVTARYAF